jgi:hypothetical protein
LKSINDKGNPNGWIPFVFFLRLEKYFSRVGKKYFSGRGEKKGQQTASVDKPMDFGR